ncbi:MAG: MgtC/SapB family protein [Chloroflexia bacterium]|nr:MgtC/SapB family protein [Chloroflexia bacterium]
MEQLSNLEAIGRIVLSLLLGGAIGWDRERANKAAGLRTYALVCQGAALFMLASVLLGERSSQGDMPMPYDPSRIGSTIVQGIGFLAAGVIFVSGNRVRGLTTAAGIWVTAALGLLVGAGFYLVAIVGTLSTLAVLSTLQGVENRFVEPRDREDERPDDGR